MSLFALLVAQSLIAGDTSSDTLGLMPSLMVSIALVFAVVAWIEGVVLALRAGSVLWLLVAALPFVVTSMMCAIFCPAAVERRR